MEEITLKWDEIKELLRVEYSLLDVQHKTWIMPLVPMEIKDDQLIICTPDNIGSVGTNYIKKEYKLPLQVCIETVTGRNYDLIFMTEAEYKKGSVSSYINGDSDNNKKDNNNINKIRAEKANLKPEYTFDTFVNGDNSSLAYAASLAVADNPGHAYNPLFIYGGAGLGKTHLMQSIGNYIIEQNSNMDVLYVTCETFMRELIESIQNKGKNSNQEDTKWFRDKYRNVDVILIDDIQFISGKKSTQEEFFHTFNELYSANKAIVLTSDRPPKELETLNERLISRFEMGLITDIQSPSYEIRVAILKKKAESFDYDIDDEIIEYIATYVKSNIRELQGALNKVVFLTKMNRDNKISLSTAKEALKDLVSPSEVKKVTPELILEVVSNYYSVSKDDILSNKRKREISLPRMVVMYLCSSMTGMNMTSIGKMLGRDHSTIIHGYNKVNEDLNSDGLLLTDINNIKKMLNI